jgi:hypothetical protein
MPKSRCMATGVSVLACLDRAIHNLVALFAGEAIAIQMRTGSWPLSSTVTNEDTAGQKRRSN